MTSIVHLMVWLKKQTLDSAMDVNTFLAGVQRNAEPMPFVSFFQLHRDGLEERIVARAALRALGCNVTVGAGGLNRWSQRVGRGGRPVFVRRVSHGGAD
jgi:hypothetical protein